MPFCPVCDFDCPSSFCGRCGTATIDKELDTSHKPFGSGVHASQVLAAICAASVIVAVLVWHANPLLRLVASALIAGASVLVARWPETVVWSRRIAARIGSSRSHSAERKRIGKVLLNPVLAALDTVTRLTKKIQDPYLCAALRLVLWTSLSIIATLLVVTGLLTLIYIGILLLVLAVAFAVLAFVIWMYFKFGAVSNSEPARRPGIFNNKDAVFRLNDSRDGSKQLESEGVFGEKSGALRGDFFGKYRSNSLAEPNIEIRENTSILGREEDRPFEVSSEGKVIGHLAPENQLFSSGSDPTYTFVPKEDDKEG